MPIDKKIKMVQAIQEELNACSVAVATDFRGLSGTSMAELRGFLRSRGLKYKVVKNTLAHRAAAGTTRAEIFGQLVDGPTGIVFGYGDPTIAAKGLEEFIRTFRSPLIVRNAVMDGNLLMPREVSALASLPTKDVLLASLLGQIQAPIYGLVNVLSAPLRGLITVLQRRVEQG
jgi:large subunit ribosomal protein L10